VLEQFHFFPGRDDVQRVALGVAENEPSTGREQLRQICIIKQLLREGGGAAADVFFAVGRVGQNQIKLPTAFGELRQRGEHVLHAHFQRWIQAGGAGIGADEFRVFG